jgi:phage tail-like protein
MPDPLMQPALSFNFWVLLWEVQGPGLFGLQPRNMGERFGVGLASGLLSATSQALFGAFSDASGLNANLDLETYQEGGNNVGPLKFPKWGKYDNVTLKRGVTPRTSLWDWHAQISSGTSPVLRKSGLVILFDRGNGTDTAPTGGLFRVPLAAWYIDNAIPERITGPTLDAKSSSVAVESVELAHEGLSRVSLSMIPGAGDAMASAGGLLGGG